MCSPRKARRPYVPGVTTSKTSRAPCLAIRDVGTRTKKLCAASLSGRAHQFEAGGLDARAVSGRRVSPSSRPFPSLVAPTAVPAPALAPRPGGTSELLA